MKPKEAEPTPFFLDKKIQSLKSGTSGPIWGVDAIYPSQNRILEWCLLNVFLTLLHVYSGKREAGSHTIMPKRGSFNFARTVVCKPQLFIGLGCFVAPASHINATWLILPSCPGGAKRGDATSSAVRRLWRW